MKKLISAKVAGNILLMLLGLLAVFHVLVLLNVLPPDIVWGGRAAESPGSLVMFEIIGLVVTLLFAGFVAGRLDYILSGKLARAKRSGVWVICFWFALNTVTNLISLNSIEQMVFAPLALIMALCALRLAVEKEPII